MVPLGKFWYKQDKSEGFDSCDRPIVRKRTILAKIGDVLSRVTLKFDGWPWKTIGHLSYATSNFVQHFIAIVEFELELQSGNTLFGWKSAILSRVTLKFDGWPWKTIGYLSCVTSNFVQHSIGIGEFKLELQSGNAQFGWKSAIFCPVWPWNLTNDLEKQQGILLYYFKLCATFTRHRWIQTGITVRKRPIWVKIGDFLSRLTLKFDGWPWKTIGHFSYATSSFVQHIIGIGEFYLELQSGNAQFGSKSAIFCPVWPWNLTDDLEKQYSTSPTLLQAFCIIS